MTNTDGAVAWQYRTLAVLPNGGRSNWQYMNQDQYEVEHKDHRYLNQYEYRPLIPADSLAGLMAERDDMATKGRLLAEFAESLADRLQAAQSTLAAVGALADEWEMKSLEIRSYAESDIDRRTVGMFEKAAARIRTIIAEAGTSGVGS